jgi:heptosyltransferase-1
MADILFVKTSSLGDVVHHMPAVVDARRHYPAARIAWLVEEAFAPLVRLHPAVDQVIPVAWRRWRRMLAHFSAWREIGASVRLIRERRYDAVIDTQGLVRTAALARIARGPRHGYDRRSVREPLAALAYDVRHAVARDLHAIERNRALVGRALGYAPAGPLDYGLDRARLVAAPLAQPYAVLLHATARAEKEWPEPDWIALGRAVAARGLAIVLPWGTEIERARSLRIKAGLAEAADVDVPDRRSLDKVARLIAGASVVIGVDTGLLHVAAAAAVPLVGIFLASAPELTGPKGQGPIAILGRKGGRVEPAEVLSAVEGVL